VHFTRRPQFERLESQNHFNVPFGIQARAPPVFPVSRAKLPHGVSYDSPLLLALFLPRSTAATAARSSTASAYFTTKPRAASKCPARCYSTSNPGLLFRPGNLVNRNAGASNNWAKAHYTEAGHASHCTPCSVAAFVISSEPHTGARPSVRVCVGPELTRCVH
jgi:hypothetical protein